jgi:hypothetical protein
MFKRNFWKYPKSRKEDPMAGGPDNGNDVD